MQLVFELFAFIFRFCEFTLEPENNDRGDDRDDPADHVFFLAMPRLTVYPIAANTVATSPSILSPPDSGAIVPDAYNKPTIAATALNQNSVVLMPFLGSSSILFFQFFGYSNRDVNNRERSQ